MARGTESGDRECMGETALVVPQGMLAALAVATVLTLPPEGTLPAAATLSLSVLVMPATMAALLLPARRRGTS